MEHVRGIAATRRHARLHDHKVHRCVHGGQPELRCPAVLEGLDSCTHGGNYERTTPMKVKKFMEFIEYLAHNRRTFFMGKECDCVAGHAERFLAKKGAPRTLDVGPDVIKRAFDIPLHDAHKIYCGPREATRKQTVAM